MSAPIQRNDSDSEDDDYIPPAEGDPESSEEEPETKRRRTSSPKLTEEDKASNKQDRDALWESFQTSVSSSTPPKPEPPKSMIKIEKRYRFAGEDVIEVVEVPEDSMEAEKWPLWRPPETTDSTSALPSECEPSNSSSKAGNESISHTASSTSGGQSVAPTKPAGKRPGPRKPRTSLAALPISSSQRPKKLSTLDKSAMDWRAHINAEQDSGLKDELDANRRGGGYLEKVEFLKRVEERKEGAIDAIKSSKRRRA